MLNRVKNSLIGKPSKPVLSEREKALLVTYFHGSLPEYILEYSRIYLNGKMLRTSRSQGNSRRNDSFITLRQGTSLCYGLLHKILIVCAHSDVRTSPNPSDSLLIFTPLQATTSDPWITGNLGLTVEHVKSFHLQTHNG